MEEKFINGLKDALEIEDKEVQLTDNFRDFEGWNSLNHLSLVAMLDEEYSVQIDNEQLNKLTTVGDLIDEVKKHL